MSRIRPGTLTVGIFAVLCSLMAAYGVRRYLEPQQVQTAAPVTRLTPKASTDLEAGRTLAKGDIMLIQKSPGDLPATAMMNPNDIIGRTLQKPLKLGDFFLLTDLYPVGKGPSLADRLKPGFRAVTVPMSGSGATGGFAAPGSFVDVLLRTTARTTGNANIPEAAFTLLEAVEVLAVDQNAAEGVAAESDPETVTLAVTPEQASILKVVQGRGELSLVLRRPEETVAASSLLDKKVTLEKLLGIEPPAAEPRFSAEIYRGSARQSLSFKREQVIEEQFGGLAQFRRAVTPPVVDNRLPKASPTNVLGTPSKGAAGEVTPKSGT